MSRYMDDEYVPSRQEWAEENGYDPGDETLGQSALRPGERPDPTSEMGRALHGAIQKARALQGEPPLNPIPDHVSKDQFPR